MASNKLSDKALRAELGRERLKQVTMADGDSLSVRISPKGAISWLFRYRLGGRESKVIWLTLGQYPETSLKEARIKRDQCRAWLDEGKDPKTELMLKHEDRMKPVSLKDALEYWLVEYAQDKRSNAAKHRSQFERHIYPYIGDLPLDKTETRHWLDCFDRIRKGIPGKQRPAPVAAGYVLQNAKQALRFCRVRHYATSRALDDLIVSDVGNKQRKKDRVLTDKELVDVWRFTDNTKLLPYYRNLLKLLIIFGARTQEVRLSKWDEWDFEVGCWTVPKANSKTSEKIVRPIPRSLYSWLMGLKVQTEDSGYLLGELKGAEAVSQSGRMLWKRLKHDEAWTLHDLRRTLATKLNDLGVMPHVVEQLLGHSLGGVMAIYNRSQYLPEKKQALNMWLERISLLSSPVENVALLRAYNN